MAIRALRNSLAYKIMIKKKKKTMPTCRPATAGKNYPSLNFPPLLLPDKLTSPCTAKLPISENSS